MLANGIFPKWQNTLDSLVSAVVAIKFTTVRHFNTERAGNWRYNCNQQTLFRVFGSDHSPNPKVRVVLWWTRKTDHSRKSTRGEAWTSNCGGTPLFLVGYGFRSANFGHLFGSRGSSSVSSLSRPRYSHTFFWHTNQQKFTTLVSLISLVCSPFQAFTASTLRTSSSWKSPRFLWHPTEPGCGRGASHRVFNATFLSLLIQLTATTPGKSSPFFQGS